MFAPVTPPAAHAPEMPCASRKPVLLYAATVVATSPDCRWQVVSFGIEARTAVGPMPKTSFSGHDNAYLVDLSARRIVSHFVMEHTAYVHWLKDGRHVIVNLYGGPGETDRSLILNLTSGRHLPVDLSAWTSRDALRRAGWRQGQTNTRVSFIDEQSGKLILAVTLQGYSRATGLNIGPGRCYVYTVEKITFRHYRFLKEERADNCPVNVEERAE